MSANYWHLSVARCFLLDPETINKNVYRASDEWYRLLGDLNALCYGIEEWFLCVFFLYFN